MMIWGCVMKYFDNNFCSSFNSNSNRWFLRPNPIAYVGLRGPMGPQGPAGISETIRVRNTITGAPSTLAQVVDVGVAPNHILDFIIPRGDVGASGDPGVAESIAVADTVTVESNVSASVEDDFAMGVHNLTFYIPKGEDSPTNNLAVAQLYKTTAQTLNATEQLISFSINQNFRNSLTTQQTIQVLNGGTYKIEFGFTFASVNNLELSLFINDLEVSNTRLSFSAGVLHNNEVYLAELAANSELSIRVQSITGEAVLPDNVMNGYLIVTPAG